MLAPGAVRRLFGDGYALRGTERVFVGAATRREVSVPVEAGPDSRLVLDALDRDTLGQSALGKNARLRLRGPAGRLDAPTVEPVARALALPAGLIRAWGLAVGQTVAVQAGAVAFGDVTVGEGEGVVYLDPADALAAGLAEGDPARWTPHLDLATPHPRHAAVADGYPTGRLVTETDVRQARLRGQTITVREGQIVTPAARSLGRDLGVFRSGSDSQPPLGDA